MEKKLSLKDLNIYWIFCSIFFYSYLPQLLDIRPFYITVLFQSFGIFISLIVIHRGIKNNSILPGAYTKLIFIMWLLYFTRMIYSLYFDSSLQLNEYLYDDLNKYITYNINIGLIILSLSTYTYSDIKKFDRLFYKTLFVFLIISLFVNFVAPQSTNNIRSDANSYIPTLSYGQYGVLLSILSMSFYMNNKKNKIIYLIGFLIGLYVFIVAGSRSSFVSFFILLLIVFIFDSKNKSLSSIIAKTLSIVLGILIYIDIEFIIDIIGKVSEGFAYRLHNTFISGSVDLGARYELYTDALNQFLESPFIGSHFVLLEGYGRGMYPHNIFLEILINLGVIGGLIFLVPFIKAMIQAFKLIIGKSPHRWVAFIFIQYFIFSMSSMPLLRHSLLISSWILILSISNKSRKDVS